MVKHPGYDDVQFLRHNLAVFILRRRELLGLTQKALSVRLGMSHASVTRMEQGKASVDAIPFSSLASALQTSEEELKWEIFGLNYLCKIRSIDLLPLVQAIAQSDITTLSLANLLDLLKIEGGLCESGFSMKKEMILGFLAQVHTKYK